MSSYKILRYSFIKAKKLNVNIKPSSNPKKKIDIFDNGVKIASIGAMGYNDFPTYVKLLGIEKARKKQNAYHKRHAHEPKKLPNGKYTPSFYADHILW